MGLTQKERKWFNDGMKKAQMLVHTFGVEMLDIEINQRCVNNAPAGVSSFEIKDAAREYASKELDIISNALAYTVAFDMGLPPSEAIDFLKKFNSKVDEFRQSDEAAGKAKCRLMKNSGMNAWLKKFNHNEI